MLMGPKDTANVSGSAPKPFKKFETFFTKFIHGIM